MIDVHYIRQGEIYMVEIIGHADYASPGEDIVCASSSMLAYTIQGAAETLPQAEVKRVIELKPGYGTILLKMIPGATHETLQKVENMIEMVMIGYTLLAETYPNHVNVHM